MTDSEKCQKLLGFVKEVATGCNGDILRFLRDLEDEAEEILKEIGELQ